jgi:hypothetical protein
MRTLPARILLAAAVSAPGSVMNNTYPMVLEHDYRSAGSKRTRRYTDLRSRIVQSYGNIDRSTTTMQRVLNLRSKR